MYCVKKKSLRLGDGCDRIREKDGGKGVRALYQRMKKAGMENVTLKLFPGARHDLLHEKKNGADVARKFIAEWIKL